MAIYSNDIDPNIAQWENENSSFQSDLSKVLNILYKMEDKTGYENKNLGEAINLLQKELKLTN